MTTETWILEYMLSPRRFDLLHIYISYKYFRVLSIKKRETSQNLIKLKYAIATTRLSRSFSLNIPPRGPTRARKESSLGIRSGFSLLSKRLDRDLIIVVVEKMLQYRSMNVKSSTGFPPLEEKVG